MALQVLGLSSNTNTLTLKASFYHLNHPSSKSPATKKLSLTHSFPILPPLSLASHNHSHSPLSPMSSPHHIYVYPDPIPEFAQAETEKFRSELKKKLFKDKETFGDDFDTVVNICAEIFSDFLHKEYGGPGTLLVEPFTDMLLALKDKKMPGAPVAARAALLWAQNYVDHDWEIWTSQHPK